jgi:hypothetical protein
MIGEPRATEEGRAVDLSPRFDEALVYARRLYAGQVRKGTTIPYVAHLLAVTAIVLEHGGGRTRRLPPCSTTRSRTRVAR